MMFQEWIKVPAAQKPTGDHLRNSEMGICDQSRYVLDRESCQMGA